MTKQKNSAYYCPSIEFRWKTQTNYRLILWAWMVNETATVFSPTEISHNGFYVHTALQVLGVLFVGIPLAYSEICIGQYTNCNVISMWNFFPLFRSVGYATLFLIILKTMYVMVLTSWYLDYAFYAALDPPPWYSCDDFNTTKCMVKKSNISVFQHCVEAQLLFEDDCGMKTASNYFFEKKIGNNNTQIFPRSCFCKFRVIILSFIVGAFLFLMSLRRDKFIQIVVRLMLCYICIAIFLLICVALSTNGTWFATKISLNWSNFTFNSCFISVVRGFLTVGTGCGIIIFISRDCPFRSPATMSSISTSLFALFTIVMLSIIAFSGIKTMSYFHGEEENVIEIGSSSYFTYFASISEIMIYFNAPIWGFFWFSIILLCLFTNLWILFIYLMHLALNIEIVQKYNNIFSVILIALICFCSWPFFCSDLTAVLTDSTELIQLINSYLFGISLYWFYGFNNHNNDITFMIGIKASYYWKICWVLNPIIINVMVYCKWQDLDTFEFDDSYYIDSISINLDKFLFYVVLVIYFFIIIVGIFIQLFLYYQSGKFKKIITPAHNWGPKDDVLFKSRKMFVPEIMTREFLYRQVRIHGYLQKRIAEKSRRQNKYDTETSAIDMKWSALTSN